MPQGLLYLMVVCMRRLNEGFELNARIAFLHKVESLLMAVNRKFRKDAGTTNTLYGR